MVTINSYNTVQQKEKMRDYYLAKANTMISIENYEEAIDYYNHGYKLAQEVLAKEYNLGNCKQLSAFTYGVAICDEYFGRYEKALTYFLRIPCYISEWSNTAKDNEVLKLLAASYFKASQYFFCKKGNPNSEQALLEGIAKCVYAVKLFTSIVKREVSIEIYKGLVISNITLGQLYLMSGEVEKTKECFKKVRKEIKKLAMLQKLSQEEDEFVFTCTNLIGTMEKKYCDGMEYKADQLYQTIHNYWFSD